MKKNCMAVWQELGFKSLIEKSDFAGEETEQAEVNLQLLKKLQRTSSKMQWRSCRN